MTDAEILEQIAARQEKMRRELRDEVESLFTKERDNFLERARLFMNVAKWSGAALLATFGLLGIKAWSDVKANVEDFFKTKLEKTYRVEDPSSPLSRSIDQLIDHAVVNALYVQVQRNRNPAKSQSDLWSRRNDQHSLTSGELDRLVRIARSPQTEVFAFEDTIFVLNALTSKEEQREAVSSTLAELLAAKEKSDFSWMASNERKRLAILSSFKRAEAVDEVAIGLLSQPVSDRLKTAALARIRIDNYKTAIPSVIKYIDATEGQQQKFDGYRTLARLRPDHDRLRQFIVSDLIKREEKSDLLRCLVMAATLAAKEGESRFFEDDEARQRHRRVLAELAIPLAAKAIESGVSVEYESFGFRQGLHAKISVGPSMSRGDQLSNAIYSNDFVSALLEFGANKSVSVLAQYIAALSGNFDRSLSPGRRVKITAKLANESELQLEDGTIVTKAKLKGESVELASSISSIGAMKDGATKRIREHKIYAIGEDLQGRRFQKLLKATKNVTFAVTAMLDDQSDDESDEF